MFRSLIAFTFVTLLGCFVYTAPAHSAGRDFDGVIAAVAPSALIMVDNRQVEVVFVVNPGTRVLRNGKPAVITQLAPGDEVRVTAITKNSKWTAKTISAIGLD